MRTPTLPTDRTYLVDVSVFRHGFKTYEVEAPAASMAAYFARMMAATDQRVPFDDTMVPPDGVSIKRD